MNNLSKLNGKYVLFLGAGGVSMHQLALAYKSLGAKVLAYDHKSSVYTKILEDNSIKVYNKFNKSFLLADICVKTGAIKDTNKILKQLSCSNCKMLDRAQALGELCSKFKTVIAVAGTHGKSTTASLIYEILRVAGKKVSCHIGADVFLPRFNLNDDILVVEACEYNKSFLNLKPTISVVTNVEAEHLDSYGSFYNLKLAFSTFLKRGDGRFVFLQPNTKFLKRIKNVDCVDNCNLKINPKLKGEYNLKNIYLAIKVCQSLGVEDSAIIKAVNAFVGVPRRFELIGNFNKTKIYVDYAHHPTEVKEFVKAFSESYKTFVVVFQPHTYSRTKMFLKQFVEVLALIPNLCIYKEYPARENKACGLSAKDLFLEIKKENPFVEYCAKPEDVIKKIGRVQAVAFVGAGDINLIAENICKTY